MKIAIIGAGFTGLSAGFTLLKKGHQVSIFEKGSAPGGLAIGYHKAVWEWTLEEYYHHWFTNDDHILALAKEINYPVIIKRPKTSIYSGGSTYQLDSPLKLLQFPRLTLLERLQMAFVLGVLRYDPFWKPLEKVSAARFLPQAMGKRAYEMIWEPQLKNKFGEYANEVSLAWFWARISKRTPSLAYPEGGFLRFSEALAKNITQMGGHIHYNSDISQIASTASSVSLGKQGIFDRAIVTLPTFAFTKLAQGLPKSYSEKIGHLKGLGAITLILRLKEKFLKDNTYWLSVCDTQSKVLAIVEHTNFMDKAHYNNEHLVYLGNYLPASHPYFSLSPEALLKEYHPFLEKLHPGYKQSLIGLDLFKTPFAQPIIPTNYSKHIPSIETPLKHVFLANMQQVYPWDRGTNYAVELGEKTAKMIG